MSGRRFLWFAPNAGNWVTYRMEHRVANALADNGDDVLMVQCDSVLDAYCQVMSPAGLSATSPIAEKRAVCRECRFAAGLARREARYRTAQLSSFLDATDWEWVEERISSTTVDNWSEIEVRGLPVGKYASYTSMLHHKRPTVTESPAAWQEYLADLRGALLVARALPRLVSSSRPTHAVVYNALYPANRVFAEGLKAAGAILLNLSGGPTVPRRYSTLAVYDGIKASQTITDSLAFRASLEVPASDLEVRHVEQHVAQLMSGSDPWVYSAAASRRPASVVRATLGVRDEAQVVTVIVSSPDETRSNLLVDAEYFRDPVNGYSDVAEYLKATISLARSFPEVDFVFRLHPRLAPNKRERISSPDLEVIYDLLTDLPGNAVVNHPGEGLSLYDLVLISAAAVNQSSSAGLEFQVFGLPVVQYDPVRQSAYPPELKLSASRDIESLRTAMGRALDSDVDPARSVRAFRWYASTQIRSVVHLDPLEDIAPSSAVGAAAPAVPSAHPLGRFVPGPIKEFLAMRLQRRRRSQELRALPALGPDATDVLAHEVDNIRGQGDIWEPYMVFPESSSIESERAAVAAALGRLVTRFDLTDPAGVGRIGQLTFSLR